MANFLERQGRPDPNVEMRQPTHFDSALKAASAAIAANDTAAARVICEDILEQVPDHPETLDLLIRCLLQQADYERILGVLESVQKPERPGFHGLMGFAALQVGRPGTAESALKRALVLSPAISRELDWLARLLRQQKRHREAARCLGYLSPIAADPVGCAYGQAAALADQHDAAGAVAVLRAAIRRLGPVSRLTRALARCLAKRLFDRAIRDLGQVSDPESDVREIASLMRMAQVDQPGNLDLATDLEHCARWLGRVGAFGRAADRRLVIAGSGGGRRLAIRRWIAALLARVRDPGALAISRGWEVADADNRVLHTPRVPVDGDWRVRVADSHADRAHVVLRYFNPGSRFSVVPEEAPEDGGLLLEMGPCARESAEARPGRYIMPLMLGHAANVWQALPNILGAGGEVDPERAAGYLLRDRRVDLFFIRNAGSLEALKRHRGRAPAIAERLRDGDSRASYLETAEGDLSRYLRSYLPNLGRRVQYFDHVTYRPGDVILNLGVDEAHEMPNMLAAIGETGCLHNIDPVGHDNLHPYTRLWAEDPAFDVVEHRMVITDTNDGIDLNLSGGREEARLMLRPTVETVRVPSRRLPDFVAEQGLSRIDLIKLDIEGSEGLILDDLIDVMNRFRAQAAVSIYHTVDQFFDIPERMMARLVDYEFSFYRYCANFSEGTLYAVPRERARG